MKSLFTLIALLTLSFTANAGMTPAQVHAAFPAKILANFAGQNVDALVARLTDVELTDLSIAYTHDAVNTTPLLALIASRAKLPLTIRRVSAVFGYVQTSNAIHLTGGNPLMLSSLSSRAMYLSAAYDGNVRALPAVSKAATVDMTAAEIYLEYRTAPGAALTVTSAAYETGSFIASNVVAAFTAGYAVGSAITFLASHYAPDEYGDASDKFGAAVDSLGDMLKNLSDCDHTQSRCK